VRQVAEAPADPRSGELASLVERAEVLGAIRLGFVAIAAATVLLVPDVLRVDARALAAGSAAYLLLLLVPATIARAPRALAQWIVGGTLLVDGVYLTWVAYATGGTASPLWPLALVHIAAAAVLLSARTGLKVAAWHSLLLLAGLYAQAAAMMPSHEAVESALPGGPRFATVTAVHIASFWVVAVATAACASVNERQLRAQKTGLAELSAMVREIEGMELAAGIPHVLLDRLCRVFGYRRGIVLAASDGELHLAASRPASTAVEWAWLGDEVTARAWGQRRSQLVAAPDPSSDPALASVLPNARGLVVVPMLADRGEPIGVVVLEYGGRRGRIRRSVLTFTERFASHAAVTLQGAWLRERLAEQLERNRALQERLREHNRELETTVQERTRDLRASLEDLRVADEGRRLLLEHLVRAEEEERRRIAGDVHDDPVQKMSAATMWIQVLRRGVSDPTQLAQLDKLMGSVRGSIASLRQLIFELRPHALDQDGLAAALRDYLESLEPDFAFHVDDGLMEEPSSELRIVLYRMAQEALANAHKHARAARVDVSLAKRDGGYIVRITDDGVGFDAPPTLRSERGHLGLSSMRERAEMAGGRCRLQSAPGRGTTVELWIPESRASSASVSPWATAGAPDAMDVERPQRAAAPLPLVGSS
jgi:signal transduction histidine kinase